MRLIAGRRMGKNRAGGQSLTSRDVFVAFLLRDCIHVKFKYILMSYMHHADETFCFYEFQLQSKFNEYLRCTL